MSIERKNTLVVDISVLPSRPDPSAAEEFIFKVLKLQSKDAKCIQYHNIDRCFYISMKDKETPLLYQRNHNLEHKMKSPDNNKLYLIPVYYLDGASTVRIHDLPPEIPLATICDYMGQYGKVESITDERWKNYFSGNWNGVRQLKMHICKPIPSYIKILGYESLCTHSPGPAGAQIKTCRYCHLPLHPNTKCGKSQQTEAASLATKQQTKQVTLSPNEYPALPVQTTLVPQAASSTTPSKQLPEPQIEDEVESNSSHEQIDSRNAKRRLSLPTAKKTTTKKQCKVNTVSGIELKNAFVLLTRMEHSEEDGDCRK